MWKYTLSIRRTGPVPRLRSCVSLILLINTQTCDTPALVNLWRKQLFHKVSPSCRAAMPGEIRAHLSNPGCISSPCNSLPKVHGEKDTHRDVDAASSQLAEPVDTNGPGLPCSSLTQWAPRSWGASTQQALPRTRNHARHRATIFGRKRRELYGGNSKKREKTHSNFVYQK